MKLLLVIEDDNKPGETHFEVDVLGEAKHLPAILLQDALAQMNIQCLDGIRGLMMSKGIDAAERMGEITIEDLAPGAVDIKVVPVSNQSTESNGN